MNPIEPGRPFFYVSRAKIPGYVSPDNERMRSMAQDTATGVLSVLRDLFGQVGVHQLLEHYPNFRADIEASVIAAYQEGDLEQYLAGSTRRSNEAMADVGRMLSALVRAPAGESSDVTTVRVLAAHAGVVGEDVDGLAKRLEKA